MPIRVSDYLMFDMFEKKGYIKSKKKVIVLLASEIQNVEVA